MEANVIVTATPDVAVIPVTTAPDLAQSRRARSGVSFTTGTPIFLRCLSREWIACAPVSSHYVRIDYDFDSDEGRLRLHLNPYFGDLPVSKINSGSAQDYRIHRAQQKIMRTGETEQTAKAPALSTIHDEIVTLRMVLKCAFRREWIAHVPDLSPAYRGNGKVVDRYQRYG
jgi:hypothetical protein